MINKIINCLFVLITMIYDKTFCQDLNGYWIKSEAQNINNAFHTNPNNIQVKGYQRLIFNNNLVEFSNSPIDFASTEKFNRTDKTIDIGIRKFNYKLIKDTLWLEDAYSSSEINTQPMQYKFIKQQNLISNLSSQFPIEITFDTLEISNSIMFRDFYSSLPQKFYSNAKYNYLIPRFNGTGETFLKYIQDNLKFKFTKTDTIKSVACTFSFLVDKFGNVSDVKIEKPGNKLLDDELYISLTSKKNKWATISNVNSFKFIVTFKYIEQDRNDAKSSNYLDDGNRFFNKKNYDKALLSYTQSINFNKANINAYYNRAAVYMELGDKEKACFDWLKIYELGFNDSYELLNEYCWK